MVSLNSFFHLWLYLLFVSPSKLVPPCEASILVNGIKNPEGTLRICVFSKKENYLGKADFCLEKKVNSLEKKQISWDGPCGYYAMVVYHDENNNGKLDKNRLGIPSEPYGFPGNPNTFFGPPSFEKAQLLLKNGSLIPITLR